MIGLLLLLSASAIFAFGHECRIRKFPSGTVCVCNSTHCDTVPSINVSHGNYQVYSTSKSKPGFYCEIGSFINNTTVAANEITVNPSVKYQTIIGFGGAFTDSTGININSLPAAAQKKLIESYFSENGIEYNLCRVPLAGTDFSTRAYSYDDVPLDTNLSKFSLQPEDFNYKIPYIQQAINLTNNKINLFGSVWTSPPWMKTNNAWNGMGLLQPQYYQLWADYIIKFFDEYKKNNISFWGMTTQNEPMDGFLPASISLNSMGWTPQQMNAWINFNLGPTLRNSTHKSVKIIIHDDQRLFLPFIQPILEDPLTMTYVDGVGVHWYTDILTPPEILKTVRSPVKDLFILGTEASIGNSAARKCNVLAVEKGSWDKAASYIQDILENLEYGVNGWVDWNMVLDEKGGPSYINNCVDSPILVNATLQEFYKQPMFYAMGHFSKFVIPGSVRLETVLGLSLNCTGIQAIAFLRPDNLTALLIYNKGSTNVSIQIKNNNKEAAVINIETKSINTVLY